jgi:hypothetical protein
MTFPVNRAIRLRADPETVLGLLEELERLSKPREEVV